MYAFFSNPWMLAALGAVLLPVIIEWLFRRRKRLIDLPTIFFLLRTKEQEKVKRQNRILLILRMAAVFLLIVAIARPLFRHGLLSGGRNRQVVVLLDGTASMNQQVGLTTAFGLAQKKAAGLIRELPEGTVVSVGVLGSRADTIASAEKDLHTAASRIESLKPSAGTAPITDGLALVASALPNDNDTVKPEVYLFTDFHTYTWTRGGKQTPEALQALTSLSPRCEGYVVDVGGQPKFNHTLADLRPEDALLSTGMPVHFRAVVATWGKPPPGKMPTVSFTVDGDKKAVREFQPGDQPVTLVFEHRFAEAGEHVVEATLEGDEFRLDNRRLCLCTVPESIAVLVLDESAGLNGDSAQLQPPNRQGQDHTAGNWALSPFSSFNPQLSYLVRAATPPTHPAAERVSRFATKVISPLQLDYENLEHYAVVVLADTNGLTDSMATKLEHYVADGGGLWLFLGPRVNLYQYNKLLFKAGQGLLPCRLTGSDSSGQAVPPAQTVFLRFGESTHPALAALSGGGNEEARFMRYMEMEPKAGARAVLALSNGVPALLESKFGRGRVLLMNATTGPAWNYLPATMEWPILVQELLRYLAGNPDAAVNLTVGDRFQEPIFITSQQLLLKLPDGRKERLTPREVEDRKDAWLVEFAGTHQQGVYEFLDVSPEVLPRMRFVVNLRAGTGDLSRFSRDEFVEVFGSAGWRWIGSDVPIEDFVAKLHSVTELAPMFLGGLVLVLALESLLAALFIRRRGGPPA